jgi:hypothetical protein
VADIQVLNEVKKNTAGRIARSPQRSGRNDLQRELVKLDFFVNLELIVWDVSTAGLIRIGSGRLQDVKNTRSVPDLIQDCLNLKVRKYLTLSEFQEKRRNGELIIFTFSQSVPIFPLGHFAGVFEKAGSPGTGGMRNSHKTRNRMLRFHQIVLKILSWGKLIFLYQ